MENLLKDIIGASVICLEQKSIFEYGIQYKTGFELFDTVTTKHIKNGKNHRNLNMESMFVISNVKMIRK